MASYYVQWLDEEPLITILYALRHLDEDMIIIIVDLIVEHIAHRWIIDSIVNDFQEVNILDDYDHVYHDWADYSDSYYTD